MVSSATLLCRSPAQPLFRRWASRRLAVLAYHDVADPDTFAQHLDFLVEEMRPVSLEAVIGAVQGGRALPPRAVLITFDDACYSVFEHGLPLMQACGLPGAVFAIAGLVDTDAPFWWVEAEALARRGGTADGFAGQAPSALVRALKRVPDVERLKALASLRCTARQPAPRMRQVRAADLRMLEAAGLTVGNHTVTHPCLTQCAEAKIKAELTEAHTALSNILGHSPKAFAYPNGDADGRVARVLEELGYEVAFLFDHALSPARPADPLRISRLWVNSSTSMDRFRLILSGLHPALLRLRERAFRFLNADDRLPG